jgi:hypothetical protein
MIVIADAICLWFTRAVLVSLNVILYFVFREQVCALRLFSVNIRYNIVFMCFDTVIIGINNFSFSVNSSSSGSLCPGVRLPRRETDHLPSAEIKNAWSCTSKPPYFMAWR